MRMLDGAVLKSIFSACGLDLTCRNAENFDMQISCLPFLSSVDIVTLPISRGNQRPPTFNFPDKF